MTQHLHTIFTPEDTPLRPGPKALSIYDEVIDLVEQAEFADEGGHPVEALILLGAARSRLASYLDSMSN